MFYWLTVFFNPLFHPTLKLFSYIIKLNVVWKSSRIEGAREMFLRKKYVHQWNHKYENVPTSNNLNIIAEKKYKYSFKKADKLPSVKELNTAKIIIKEWTNMNFLDINHSKKYGRSGGLE